LADGLHDWGRRVMSLLNYAVAIALQLRKSTENLSRNSRVVFDTNRCVDIAAFLGAESSFGSSYKGLAVGGD
jgi:hypothetical protein